MKIGVKYFSNKTFYTLSAVLILIIIGGFVFAYQSGKDPSVLGHSAEEIEIKLSDGTTITNLQNAITNNLIGGGMAFGSWETKSAGLVYRATTDGIVVAHANVQMAFSSGLKGYTDSNNPPVTLRTGEYFTKEGHGGITMPVKKGDYWKVDATLEFSIFWLPIITSSAGGSGGGVSFGWVNIPIGGSDQVSQVYYDGKTREELSPTKICQNAGYTTFVGSCRTDLPAGHNTEGTLATYYNFGQSRWYWSCNNNYAEGSIKIGVTQFLCVKY